LLPCRHARATVAPLSGFGKAFVTAADREWGGIHDDLIDAVD
jgi:dipeptidyl aminopeptidase/acylaminoacyl peptidase